MYLVFTLLAAQLFPFFGVVGDVYATSQLEIAQAQSAQEVSSVSFDPQSHELVISLLDSQVATEYAVFYETDSSLDGAQGQITEGSTQVFLGTQSGEDVVKATPSRIIVKITSGNFGKTIQIEADIAQLAANQDELAVPTELSFVSYVSESLEVSDSEKLWLQHGTFNVESVVKDTKYTYPANDSVSVTFTTLPEQSGDLSIKEVTLSDEVVTEVGALSATAYEITSSMENGTFTYDLTLPNPVPDQEVRVQFSENGEDFVEAQPDEISLETKDEKNIVRITGLDHFTVFVVVPADVVPSNILQFTQQGWRMTSQGTASISLATVSSQGATELAGPHSIRMNRAGGSGTNRSYLGYYETGLELSDIEELSWNRYSILGNDTYLNIFLSTGSQTATVVYNPATAIGTWQESTFDSTSTGITIRVGSVTTPISYTDLMANYGSWSVRNNLFCKVSSSFACFNPANYAQIGGIVFVSGSSTPTAAQNHLYDGITLDFVGSEPQYFDFVDQEPPAFQTIAFGQEVNETYSVSGRNGIKPCLDTDHIFTNQNASGKSRQVLEWTPIAGAQSYQFRSFKWNATNWTPTGASASTIPAAADFTVAGYDTTRFANTAGFQTYTEFDTTNNVFRYITMGTAEGTYTRSVKAFTGVNASGYLIGDTDITQEDLLIGGSAYSNLTVCSKLTIDRSAPSVPINGLPNNTLQNSNNFWFTWSDVSADDSGLTYEFQSSLSPSNASGVLNSGVWKSTDNQSNPQFYPLNTPTIHSTGAPDGTWHWQVRAVDSANNKSDWSEIWDVTLDTIAPAAPTISFPITGDAFKTIPILNDWNDVIDASGIQYYRVEYIYEDGHTFTGGPYRIVTASQRDHVPAIGEQGGVTISVQAVDNAGNMSAWSVPVSYDYDATAPTNPGTPNPTPTSPTNIVSQVWNWTPASDTISGVSKYLIASVEVIGGIAGDILGWTDNGLLTNTNTNFGEGIWKFFVKAVDKAGNESAVAASLEYVVDLTPPVAPTLNTPQDKWATKGVLFTQTWYPVSDATVYEYESCNNNSGIGGGICTSVKFLQTFIGSLSTTKTVTAGQPNSNFWWRVRAQDAAGNWSDWSESRQLIIDNDLPTISLNTPFPATGNTAAGFTADSTPTFAGSTTDQYLAGIEKVEFKVEGISGEVQGWTNATLTGSLGDITRAYTATTNLLADGTLTVFARSYDRAGNVSSVVSQSFTVDTTAPVANFDDITNGDILSGTVEIKGTIDELNLLRYFYRIQKVGGPVVSSATVVTTTLNNETFYTWDTTDLGDGEYTILLASRDKAGNRTGVSEKTITVLVDNTKPSSTITGPGLADSENPNTIYVNEWDGSVLGTASDPIPGSGLAGVELSIQRDSDDMYWNGTDWEAETDPSTPIRVLTSTTDSWANWNYQLTGLINQDTYTVISKAFDAEGNKENSAHLIIILDKTIPEVNISVDPTNPDGAGNWYKTRPTVTLTANDAYTTIDEIQYQWNSQADSSWVTYTVPFQIPAEGNYILYYRSRDVANNYSGTGIKNLAWDSTVLTQGPLNVKADPDRTSGSTSKITWTAATDNIGIDKYEIIWKLKNGSTQFNKSVNGSTFETTIDQMTSEGEWEVIVKAFDQVGNSKEASTTVTIDKTAPAAPVLTLTGTTLGSASLSWQPVVDASRYIVYYGVNSGEYIFAASVGNVTSYTVQGLAGGNYYFMVRAVDSTDNQSANSNEVNSGTIAGVVGANPLIPVVGFAPAGEVLGDQDPSPDELTDRAVSTGAVAGTSDEQCSTLRTNLPWILLGILAFGGMLIEVVLKRRTGLVKFAISGGLLVSTLLAYYLLRNTSCVDSGTVLSLITNWFWIVAAVVAGIIRLVGYAFLEEVEL